MTVTTNKRERQARMNAVLDLVRDNLHEVRVDGARMLFHIPTTSLFALDQLSGQMIDSIRDERLTAGELVAKLSRLFSEEEVAETLKELVALELVSDGGQTATNPVHGQIEKFPLNTLVLNVNTGCNLSCTYCYKEDLDKPSAGKKMDFETARASIDMLLAESPDEKRYTVVFFGGEPLSNFPLIRDVVEYCEARFGALGKKVDFTVATMLTGDIIEWLNAHRFGVSISMDGPKAVHDRNRVTVSGRGTYDTVRRKAELLLSQYDARPVGARVTLTRGTTDVEGIWDHLFNELGFAEVGFAPVTSGDISSFNLTEEELVEVFASMKRLGQRYLDAALEHRNIGFSNLHQLITDLHEGQKRALPCGAGLKMLAVDHKGELNLCHRFTGSKLPTFGNVATGVKRAELAEFLGARLDRSGTGCETCRIRNLCSGGCYHESYARYGDPSHPTYHYCDLMRDWVDFGIEVYSRIMAANPAFIDHYISPRRAH
jgi:uncharacterized protein